MFYSLPITLISDYIINAFPDGMNFETTSDSFMAKLLSTASLTALIIALIFISAAAGGGGGPAC